MRFSPKLHPVVARGEGTPSISLKLSATNYQVARLNPHVKDPADRAPQDLSITDFCPTTDLDNAERDDDL